MVWRYGACGNLADQVVEQNRQMVCPAVIVARETVREPQMNSGDVMKKTWARHVLHARGWVIGSAAVLFLSAGGLTLLAQQALEQTNLITGLLALHLAFWSYVLGIVALALLPLLEFIGWVRVHVKRVAMNRYSSVEPRRRELEMPDIEGHQVQPNVPL